jgi:hypothetical protein
MLTALAKRNTGAAAVFEVAASSMNTWPRPVSFSGARTQNLDQGANREMVARLTL